MLLELLQSPAAQAKHQALVPTRNEKGFPESEPMRWSGNHR